MRNVSRALAAGAVAGALTVGAVGGAAMARLGDDPAAGYELLAADSAADEAVALATETPSATPTKERKARHDRLRLAVRRALIGVHGEATVKAREGEFATWAWQRGDVTAVSGGSVTVKSADGVSWTWTVNGDTRLRKNGEKAAASAVAAGDDVFVLGKPSGDARTAASVVVPKRA
ncbi:hypothetical protein [Sphaerisporangium sp. TRM90804]|uniref:hypothetical protein n=1 Tax=Sphaerisporangium sp. TRM90804 TaxID=3031113 RepID=UPI00244B6191|nr:hypothetical protein [Sphaerisporangium sp. TRM90804]MDH2427072.1 hypothetical protein [Sphaerisporangium sp. TRM90804]